MPLQVNDVSVQGDRLRITTAEGLARFGPLGPFLPAEFEEVRRTLGGAGLRLPESLSGVGRPPENVRAMARIATGERLIASYGVTDLVEMGVADIIQTGINHVGGIAPMQTDAASPNFLVKEICSGVVPEKKEEWFGLPAMRMVGRRFLLGSKPGPGFHPDGSVAEW